MTKKKKTPEEVAQQIVADLQAAGLTPNEMLYVIRIAQMKYKRLVEQKGK